MKGNAQVIKLEETYIKINQKFTFEAWNENIIIHNGVAYHKIPVEPAPLWFYF